MKNITKYWVVLLFLLSLISIISALTAEYIFDLAPCKMCLKQRYPYYVIVSIIIIFYLFKQIKNILLFILSEFAIIYGLFYAIWHVGIEKKILSGPISCSGTLLNTNSIQNLKEQISNQAIVNCNEIVWVILGLSAATINSILLLLILTFNSIYIVSKFYEKKNLK